MSFYLWLKKLNYMAITWTSKSKGDSGFGGLNAIDNTGAFITEMAAPFGNYKTLNQGTSWASFKPSAFKATTGIALDSDGSACIITYQNSSDTYNASFTVNSGTNWATPFDSSCFCCDLDSDGSVMIYGTSTRLYLSTNSGTNFNEVQPAGNVNKNWQTVCVDDDGSVIYAGNTLRLYKSINSGSTWIEVQPAGNADKQWYSVQCDSTGTTVVAQAYSGRTYISTDTGANWTEIAPSGTASNHGYRLSMSSDGKVITASDNNGRIWISTDTGTTWAETRPINNADYNWCCSVSGDGKVLYASNLSSSNGTSYYGTISSGSTGNFFQLF